MASPDDIERLGHWDSGQICGYLGREVRKMRQAIGWSQARFADWANIPLRTYKRFETHGNANLDTFVAVLKALGRERYLFQLFPVAQAQVVSLDEKLRAVRARAGMASATPQQPDDAM